jgi:serine/threonine protein kinase
MLPFVASYPPLGPYEPLGLLGKGGMAEVFHVRHKVIGSEFALKRMRLELAQEPQLRALFESELRLLVTLRHPNVVDVHDVFSAEDGAPVIVMELVQAPSLRKVIEKRALSVREILAVSLALASGLDHAHRARIVHCDLKPDNVILPESDPQRAKIIDFGIARLSSSERRSTRMGTLPYMAPEQLEGRDVDARTDLFAFGVILYELLEGKLPVDVPSAEESVKKWRSIDLTFERSADAPRDLHDLCRQCLSFRPLGRPKNAASVVQRLRYIDATMRAFVDSSWNRRAPSSQAPVVAIGFLVAVFTAVAVFALSKNRPLPGLIPAHASDTFALPELVPLHGGKAMRTKAYKRQAQVAPLSVSTHAQSLHRRNNSACQGLPCLLPPVPQRLDESEDLYDPNAEDESLAND